MVVSDKVMTAYATAMSGPGSFVDVSSLLHPITGSKSAAEAQHIDAATPQARARSGPSKQLPDFNHLPSYVQKIK